MTRAGQPVPEGEEVRTLSPGEAWWEGRQGGVGSGVAEHEEPTREEQQGMALEVPRPVSDPGCVAN